MEVSFILQRAVSTFASPSLGAGAPGLWWVDGPTPAPDLPSGDTLTQMQNKTSSSPSFQPRSPPALLRFLLEPQEASNWESVGTFKA